MGRANMGLRIVSMPRHRGDKCLIIWLAGHTRLGTINIYVVQSCVLLPRRIKFGESMANHLFPQLWQLGSTDDLVQNTRANISRFTGVVSQDLGKEGNTDQQHIMLKLRLYWDDLAALTIWPLPVKIVICSCISHVPSGGWNRCKGHEMEGGTFIHRWGRDIGAGKPLSRVMLI